MADDTPEERARQAVAGLLPIRASLARRLSRLRARADGVAPSRASALSERALRCEHVARLLDARIRLAAEQLANGEIAPIQVDQLPPEHASSPR